jgi:hypothetical protein
MAAASKEPRSLADRLHSFDRRWIFLAMGLAIVIPLLSPLNLPFKPSPMVKALYDTVESLQEGDVVYLSVDLDPASTPELEPFFRAVVLHLKRKNVKIAIGSTWYAAPPLVERWVRDVVEPQQGFPGQDGYQGKPDRPYEKNVDYTWLGFREGKEAVINRLGSDLRGNYSGRAADGTPLDRIPFMKGKKRLADFDLVILVSAGSPGAKEFVQQVQTRYNIPMVASVTSVMTTDLTPYYQAKQLLGLAGGMLASAEYEQLVGKPGLGAKAADVLSVGHLVVILAIVFGNIIFFISRPGGVRWLRRLGRRWGGGR